MDDELGVVDSSSTSTFEPQSYPNVVLRSYFPTVIPLQDYLWTIIEAGRGGPAFIEDETDTMLYRKFLQGTYVANTRTRNSLPKFKSTSPMGPLQEVVRIAQERLVSRKSKSVLVIGYREASRRVGSSISNVTRVNLVNYAVNTTVTAFASQEWQTLHSRIGEDSMLHLLVDTSIFVPLPNDCLCQITGEPIINMPLPKSLHQHTNESNHTNDILLPSKRSSTTSIQDERQTKRPRVDAGTYQNTVRSLKPKRKPADIQIVRARMFYYRPYYANHSKIIAFGLPPHHILNRLSVTSCTTTAPAGFWADPDPQTQMKNAVHFSKYVFPSEYKLTSAFSEDNKQPSIGRFADYMDREVEIKAKGPCRIPKRLKSVVDLLEKTIWRHSKCGYKPLLNKICPSKIKMNKERALDSSVILEMISEDSVHIHSQAINHESNVSFDSEGRTIQAIGLSQAQGQVKQKPRFIEFACSYIEVYRYAILITKTVIPKVLWGSEKNFKIIKQHIWSLVTLRRYESLTLHHILQGFCTMDCDWLALDTFGAREQSRVSVTDSLKRLELVEQFLLWFFDSFLVPLLRTNFYITESGAFRNKILYFRQDDWATLCEPLIERLSTETFQKISQHDAGEILNQRKLGFSFVRLLPKETGVRPIVNLQRKIGKDATWQYARSINQILGAAFQILTYEREVQQPLLGASVFGPNEIYKKLSSYKARLLENSPNGSLPSLYMVKVDVTACFDTIEQTKLLEILRALISEDEYTINRHGQIGIAEGKLKRRYVRKALPADEDTHFLRLASKLAGVLREVIFVDQVVYPSVKKQEILELLEEHITENIVKIGNDYYSQVVGIPQGSVLSTLLCSFFYGDMERTRLKFAQDDQSTLLRLVDDYLLVTTSLPQAKKFLDVMREGHPEYGCFISQEKTLTNFEDGNLGNVVDRTHKVFPWCGYLIDMDDLSVSVDYSRYHETYLQDSLTVGRGSQPGRTFLQKMTMLARSRSHIIYNDSNLSSSHTIYKNIHQNFLLLAMKMYHYVRSWNIDVIKNSQFILKTVRQLIRYNFATIRSKAENKLARKLRARCEVQRGEVLWLGTHAFYTVLSQKPHAYIGVIKPLKFDMSLPQHRRFKKHFHCVIKDGQNMLAMLNF